MVLAVAIAAIAALPATADAFIYWTNQDGDTIGRANLDGSSVSEGFIGGDLFPCGVAVDSTHIYWSDEEGAISRANLDGSNVQAGFLNPTSIPCGIAVDGSHIYWAQSLGAVGRANVDGTHVNQSFIGGQGDVCGVAIDSQHVYWATWQGPIGRANLDGTGVQNNFINVMGNACGIAVDSAHVYWTNSLGTIGRANLDGSGVKQGFIDNVSNPCGVAVDSGHLYWSNTAPSSPGSGAFAGIGRANLDGTGVNQSFIGNPTRPCGLAVDALSGVATTKRPAIRHMDTKPWKFRPATRGPAISDRRPPPGTIVRYRDKRGGKAEFTVLRRVPGVLRGSRCVPAGQGDGHKCHRLKPVGSFTRRDKAGRNHFTFTGRVDGRRLTPGKYRLHAIPVRGNGVTGPGSTASFKMRRLRAAHAASG